MRRLQDKTATAHGPTPGGSAKGNEETAPRLHEASVTAAATRELPQRPAMAERVKQRGHVVTASQGWRQTMRTRSARLELSDERTWIETLKPKYVDAMRHSRSSSLA